MPEDFAINVDFAVLRGADTGKRDLKEVYAYDASPPGVTRPRDVRKA